MRGAIEITKVIAEEISWTYHYCPILSLRMQQESTLTLISGYNAPR